MKFMIIHACTIIIIIQILMSVMQGYITVPIPAPQRVMEVIFVLAMMDMC